MKSFRQIIFTLLILVGLFSCNKHSPRDYFSYTTLNSNKVLRFGSPYFKDLKMHKLKDLPIVENGQMKMGASSYTEYVEKMTIYEVEMDINNIRKLKSTSETEKMINASLDLFSFIEEKYKTDYVRIAKMMDENSSSEKIDSAIIDLEKRAMPTINTKYQTLMDIALPYAKEHDIEVHQVNF